MAERPWVIINDSVVKETLSAELTFKLWSTQKFKGVERWRRKTVRAEGDSPDEGIRR